jgi:hypothetical protein
MNKERVKTLAKTSWPYIETEKIDDDDHHHHDHHDHDHDENTVKTLLV